MAQRSPSIPDETSVLDSWLKCEPIPKRHRLPNRCQSSSIFQPGLDRSQWLHGQRLCITIHRAAHPSRSSGTGGCCCRDVSADSHRMVPSPETSLAVFTAGIQMAIFHFSHNLVTPGSARGVRFSAWKGWQTSARIRQD